MKRYKTEWELTKKYEYFSSWQHQRFFEKERKKETEKGEIDQNGSKKFAPFFFLWTSNGFWRGKTPFKFFHSIFYSSAALFQMKLRNFFSVIKTLAGNPSTNAENEKVRERANGNESERAKLLSLSPSLSLSFYTLSSTLSSYLSPSHSLSPSLSLSLSLSLGCFEREKELVGATHIFSDFLFQLWTSRHFRRLDAEFFFFQFWKISSNILSVLKVFHFFLSFCCWKICQNKLFVLFDLIWEEIEVTCDQVLLFSKTEKSEF